MNTFFTLVQIKKWGYTITNDNGNEFIGAKQLQKKEYTNLPRNATLQTTFLFDVF